jgi:glycine cleavage system aminomethyltransferase T
MRSLFSAGGEASKYIDLPIANYATLPYDQVTRAGAPVGLSTYTGYTYNERAMVSLGIVDRAHSEPGTELTVVWGEAGRGSSKPTVERHAQSEIRVTVAPVPLSQVARTAYRPR